jgi:hypothetical protein
VHPNRPLNRFLLYQYKTELLLLPKQCSFRAENKPCNYPPSEVISVLTESGEYMVGVICPEHKSLVRGRIEQRQAKGEIPDGKIRFQDIKMVTTNCIKVY